jgi:glucose-1-phosphate thymidylyltransferase
MRVAPVVLACGRPGAFEGLTGGLPGSHVKVGGKRLYQYAADALLRLFGRVYVVAPRPGAGPYTPIEGRSETLEGALLEADAHLGAETHVLFARGEVYVGPAAFAALVEGAASAGADGAVLAVPRSATAGYITLRTRCGELLAGVGGESQLVFGGAALLPRDVIEALDGRQLGEALGEAAETRKIVVVPWAGAWHEVSYPEDLIALLEHVAPRETRIASGARISPAAVIEGPVCIEEGAEIDHYAVIKGPAHVGRGAFVGSHALVRNYADIEAGAVIGSGAEVSHSLVGERATIGRASFISYSVIGEEAVVEPGVMTMSVLREGRERLEPVEVRGRRYYKLGALVPRGSKVPAGTILRPGHGW